jgi:hypothetical protein
MKTSLKLLALSCLVCLVSSALSAQQKARKKRSASSTICRVESVPRDMVIVGYKTNPACGEEMEIVVKRPGASEIVCADSPIPDGFTVDGIRGSLTCGGGNLLSNALSITNADSLYGIRVGMTKFQVESELGSPTDVHRGTKTNPGKGTTWSYDTRLKTTLIYFDENFIVVDFEEKYSNSRPNDAP